MSYENKNKSEKGSMRRLGCFITMLSATPTLGLMSFLITKNLNEYNPRTNIQQRYTNTPTRNTAFIDDDNNGSIGRIMHKGMEYQLKESDLEK